MRHIRRVKVGDPLCVDLMNALIDLANRANLTVAQSCGLTLTEGPGGYVLGLQLPTFYWAKTTGPISGGTYPFTQQWPTSSGGWIDGPLTDVAYESNGNTGVPTGTYIQIYRTSQGDWRFRSDSC